MKLRVYADGASRGNPGPAAIAYTVYTDAHAKLREHAARVGTRTNNQAEYLAVLAALEYVATTSTREVACYLDSELVVNQLNGTYRVRNPTLRRYWVKVHDVEHRIGTVSIAHLPREHRCIREVDRLANRALDAQGA